MSADVLQKAHAWALEWYLEQGVDEILGEEPVDRTKMPESLTAGLNISPQGADEAHTSSAKSPRQVSAPVVAREPAFLGTSEARSEAVRLAAEAKTLEDLQDAIREYEGIAIKKTATNLVFADGNPKSPVMLVGEAPGADEDRLGKPFVGASGQLLDKMLGCIGLSREEEDPAKAVYIANILNWRPPGNRNPSPAEVELSLPFVERHIQLINPKILIFCGGVSAKALLASNQSVSKLRNSWHEYETLTPELKRVNGDSLAAIVTYHPSYLLRSPSQKKLSWVDMLKIQCKINGL